MYAMIQPRGCTALQVNYPTATKLTAFSNSGESEMYEFLGKSVQWKPRYRFKDKLFY
jgi:hypothetical protein